VLGLSGRRLIFPLCERIYLRYIFRAIAIV
jgi:hypothetical protein